MDINLTATFADIKFKFKLLQHFQKYYLRRDRDVPMRSMMVTQTIKVVREIGVLVGDCPLLRSIANEMIKEYDVNLILIVARNANE